MSDRLNAYGQPIGPDVAGWTGAQPANTEPMEGRLCRLEALNVARHGDALFDAYGAGGHPDLWTYMPFGPFPEKVGFLGWLAGAAVSTDPLFFAILDRSSGKAIGVASYLRITPMAGTIEVGSIAFSPRLQRTAHATECMFLMMKRVFDDWGYRRYEWKCDALNAPSRRAAARFGFSYDGMFRQALVYKGRNRDTTWFSILDRDWPRLRTAYETWLAPENFDGDGRQRCSLADLTAS